MTFQDRQQAGRALADALPNELSQEGAIILAIPRGGVVIGDQIARALNLPLDVWIARKIGAPGNPELALGAVTPSGTVVLDDELVRSLAVPEAYLREETERQRLEANRRRERFQLGDPPELSGKHVVLVDDGIATGATAEVSLKALAQANPAQIILAVPVAPPETVQRLSAYADQIIALHTPSSFGAVGRFYQHFPQTGDEEVLECLRAAQQRPPSDEAR